MSDWVKKMKSDEDEKIAKNKQEVELQLHRKDIITAKAPAFWRTLISQVESDCSELNETFKNDLSKQCDFKKENEHRFLLQSNVGKRCMLFLTLNTPALRIEEELHEGLDRQKKRDDLDFSIDKNDVLTLSGRYGKTPEVIAEALIKRVIGAGG